MKHLPQTLQGNRTPSRELWLRALALCGFSVWAYIFGAAIQPNHIVVIPGYDPRLDPHHEDLGLSVPVKLKRSWGAKGLKSDRIVLIAIGSCASCSIPSIPPAVLAAGGTRPLVGVFSDDRVSAPEWRLGAPYSVLSLPPDYYAKLNAAWPARLYLLNEEGDILDVQQHSESAVQTCERWML